MFIIYKILSLVSTKSKRSVYSEEDAIAIISPVNFFTKRLIKVYSPMS